VPVRVAEYLGIDAAGGIPITPINVETKPSVPCLFRNDICSKAKQGNQPICSVRHAKSDTLWISCRHRFCASSPKDSPLNEHQIKILKMVASAVYQTTLPDSEILVKREVPIPITARSNYLADFVMARLRPNGVAEGYCIVEMQGGGETTNTGKLSATVRDWARNATRNNQLLMAESKANVLATNAWRRQQEQFLVKGNVAMLIGARMVFCVGQLIYDYLIQRLTSTNLQTLDDANWTLALFAISEDPASAPPACAPNSIQLRLDPARTKYTNYNSFVQALTNQGTPQPQILRGNYLSLSGLTVHI
jgi:hypothetical protein